MLYKGAPPSNRNLSIFKDQYVENVEISASAGNNTLSATTVPSGIIRVITNIMVCNITTQSSLIVLHFSIGGQAINIYRLAGPVAGDSIQWSGKVYLKNPDVPKVELRGCNSSDTLYFHLFGYDINYLT